MIVELYDDEDQWLVDIDLPEEVIDDAIENYTTRNPGYSVDGFMEWLNAHKVKASRLETEEYPSFRFR